MSTETITMPSIAVGQVWQYLDPREGGRTITITRVENGRAYFTNRRGEVRSISIFRLGSTRVYRFVR